MWSERVSEHVNQAKYAVNYDEFTLNTACTLNLACTLYSACGPD